VDFPPVVEGEFRKMIDDKSEYHGNWHLGHDSPSFPPWPGQLRSPSEAKRNVPCSNEVMLRTILYLLGLVSGAALIAALTAVNSP
jgi:hypothetical protein